MLVVGALWGLPTQQQNLHRLTATDAKLWAISTKPKLQQSGEFRMPAIDIGQLDLTSEVAPQTVEMPIHVYTMIVVALSHSSHHTAGTVLRILEKPDGLD